MILQSFTECFYIIIILPIYGHSKLILLLELADYWSEFHKLVPYTVSRKKKFIENEHFKRKFSKIDPP